LVSGHKIGYQIAYLRNWSPYFIFATAALAMTVLGDVTVAGSSGEVLTDVDGSSVCVARVAFASVLVTRVKSWIFLEIPPGVSWKSPGNLFS